jgi:hypothetical protein
MNKLTYQGQVDEAGCPAAQITLEWIATEFIWPTYRMDEAMVGRLGQKGHSVPQPHGHAALYRIITRSATNVCSYLPWTRLFWRDYAQVTHSTPEGPSFH